MIHSAFIKSEIARRYYAAAGEELSRQEAANRWRMLRNPNRKLLQKVIDEVTREQKKEIKLST